MRGDTLGPGGEICCWIIFKGHVGRRIIVLVNYSVCVGVMGGRRGAGRLFDTHTTCRTPCNRAKELEPTLRQGTCSWWGWSSQWLARHFWRRASRAVRMSPNPNLVEEFAQIPSLPSAPELELVKFELASKLVEQLNPSFIIAPPSTFLLEIGFRVNSFKLGKLKRNHGKH